MISERRFGTSSAIAGEVPDSLDAQMMRGRKAGV